MQSTRELKVGRAYFMVTYPDPEMCKPVVLSYELVGPMQLEDGGRGFEFKFLPPFEYEDPEFIRLQNAPTFLTEEQTLGLSTLDELIAELTSLAGRSIA